MGSQATGENRDETAALENQDEALSPLATPVDSEVKALFVESISSKGLQTVRVNSGATNPRTNRRNKFKSLQPAKFDFAKEGNRPNLVIPRLEISGPENYSQRSKLNNFPRQAINRLLKVRCNPLNEHRGGIPGQSVHEGLFQVSPKPIHMSGTNT